MIPQRVAAGSCSNDFPANQHDIATQRNGCGRAMRMAICWTSVSAEDSKVDIFPKKLS